MTLLPWGRQREAEARQGGAAAAGWVGGCGPWLRPPARREVEAERGDCGVAVPATRREPPLCSGVGLDRSAVSMCNPSQVQMEQGAEGLNQWHVASHQFTEVSQDVTPGHRVGLRAWRLG